MKKDAKEKDLPKEKEKDLKEKDLKDENGERKMPREGRKSIFFKFFSQKDMKSTTLADVIRQLEEEEERRNEELDLLAFLNEDVDSNRSISVELAPTAPKKKMEPEPDPGFAWFRRKSKGRKDSSDLSLSTSVESITPPPTSPRPSIESEKEVQEPPAKNPQVSFKSENIENAQGKEQLPTTKQNSTEQAPTTNQAPATKEETSSDALKAQKTARDLVLEQRAAIAEKRARFLKLLKEQAEKDIKNRDFAFSPQDPRHWGEKDPNIRYTSPTQPKTGEP